MIPKLSQELAEALTASGDEPLEVVNPNDNRTYVVVDGETHRQAMQALRRQQDREAIAEGIAQMEAGEGTPIEDAFEEILELDRLARREASASPGDAGSERD